VGENLSVFLAVDSRRHSHCAVRGHSNLLPQPNSSQPQDDDGRAPYSHRSWILVVGLGTASVVVSESDLSLVKTAAGPAQLEGRTLAMSEHEITGESGFAGERKRMNLLPFGAEHLGQSCPKSCPQRCPHREGGEFDEVPEPLGEPLSIREVADLIGCSAWTIRQRYLRAGIPFVRLGPRGKLTFYRNQIIHWLLDEQQKGGVIP
jgi:hypothetical protein